MPDNLHHKLDHIRVQYEGIKRAYPSADDLYQRRLRSELDVLEEHLLGEKDVEAIELRVTIHSLVIRLNPGRGE